MRTLVIYDSKFGNTARIAHAIGDCVSRYSTVQVLEVGDLKSDTLDAVDLLFVGGPTQGHGVSPALRTFVEQLEKGALRNVRAAAFDTRFRLPRIISGSAGDFVAARLKRAGAELIAPPASFFVDREKTPELEEGEVERARDWALEMFGLVAVPV